MVQFASRFRRWYLICRREFSIKGQAVTLEGTHALAEETSRGVTWIPGTPVLEVVIGGSRDIHDT